MWCPFNHKDSVNTQPCSVMFYGNTLIRKTAISFQSMKSSANTCSLLLLHVVLWHPARAGVPLPSLEPPQPLQHQQETSASAGPATALPLGRTSLSPGRPCILGILTSPLSQPLCPLQPQPPEVAPQQWLWLWLCSFQGTGAQSGGPGDLTLVSVCIVAYMYTKSVFKHIVYSYKVIYSYN